MTDLITINDIQIEQLTYHDQPVVTFEMIAKVHGVPVQNVHKAFARHQTRFEEGKHVYRLYGADAQLILGVQANPNGLRLFTQKGYLLLVKPMKDEQSWQVQERMIDEYFHLRALQLPGLQAQLSPLDAYPELKAISTLVLSLAEQRHELEVMKAEQSAQKDTLIAHYAKLIETHATSQRAEAKTDRILKDLQWVTIRQYVHTYKLQSTLPKHLATEYGLWLTDYCIQEKIPTYEANPIGQVWHKENTYPIAEIKTTLMPWMKRRASQITLIPHVGA